MDEQLQALMALVATEEGMSVARVAKKLGLGQSQLLRMITALGPSETVGGLGLLELRDGDPPRLYLSERARQWAAAQTP